MGTASQGYMWAGAKAECGRRPIAQKIFASVGQKHQYRAGDTLIEQGKPSDQCYYILKVRL